MTNQLQVIPVNMYPGIMNRESWKRTHKKSYEVSVCLPKLGTSVTNRLEGVNYVTDQNKCFVIRGTVGETWVIDANKIAKTYQFVDGTPINGDTWAQKSKGAGWVKLATKPGGGTNFAFFVPANQVVAVPTSWGDVLYANRPGIPHGRGDFIVCAECNGSPNLNDMWVVNGEVFPTTYDMRGFPGMTTTRRR